MFEVDTDRPGNDKDVFRWKELLPKLGYRTIRCPEDPTSEQMKDALKALKNYPTDELIDVTQFLKAPLRDVHVSNLEIHTS